MLQLGRIFCREACAACVPAKNEEKKKWETGERFYSYFGELFVLINDSRPYPHWSNTFLIEVFKNM